MIVTCKEGDIYVPWFDSYLPREKLTSLVISIDLAIVVGFIIYIYGVKNCIKKESKLFDVETITVTDFALRFKNLPN